MAYATQTDIVDRIGEPALLVIADRDGNSVVDVAVVARALEDAAAEIDTYISAKYTLPLPVIPRPLVLLCVDIAVYRLSSDALQSTDDRRKHYEDAIALLRDISKGAASLGLVDVPDSANGGVYVSAQPRRFGRKDMRRLL